MLPRGRIDAGLIRQRPLVQVHVCSCTRQEGRHVGDTQHAEPRVVVEVQAGISVCLCCNQRRVTWRVMNMHVMIGGRCCMYHGLLLGAAAVPRRGGGDGPSPAVAGPSGRAVDTLEAGV